MAALELAPWNVVVMPVPFTERQAGRRRPALVLSSAGFSRATRAQRNVVISELDAAGLPSACLVRMKLFTLDHRLVLKRAGRLAANERDMLAARWRKLVFP